MKCAPRAPCDEFICRFESERDQNPGRFYCLSSIGVLPLFQLSTSFCAGGAAATG
jgi:hypothetical protein